VLYYRIIISLIAPFILAALLARVLVRRETLADFRQRLGGGSAINGTIWLHGASNGELTSARALIGALRSEFAQHPLVVTANTISGRDLVAGWRMPGVHARLAPLDLRWVLARFRRAIQPHAEIILENELWPNRIETSPVPVVCFAARMSARSFLRWQRLGRPGRAVLGRIDWLSAQDAASADRFEALGVGTDRIGPVISLKPGVALPPPPEQELARLRPLFKRGKTVLAASTHKGEDAIVLAAFNSARAAIPELKLILAPRHPRRSAEISGLLAGAGMQFAVRSQNQDVNPETEVFLADTLGEMPLWYALAGITFVGGSLVDKGGHTPFEPVQAGSAVVHGPYVSNFQAPYDALDAAGGAIRVFRPADFAETLCLLAAPQGCNEIAESATRTLDKQAGNNDSFEPVLAVLRRRLGNTPG